jgi:FKBP-type peptidyl-prolyl cis-trans isomerase
MRMRYACVALPVAALVLAVCAPGEKRLIGKLSSEPAKLSYALGIDMGARYRRIGADLDLRAVANGVADTLRGAALKVSDQESATLRREFARAAFTRRNSDSAATVSYDEVIAGALDKLDTLTTAHQRMNYAEGVAIGVGLQRTGVDICLPCFVQGIADTLYGGRVVLSVEEMSGMLKSLADSIKARERAERVAEAGMLQSKGQELLRANAARDDIIVTKSGLQYQVVKKGSGPFPARSSRVLVHFVSRRADSTIVEDTHSYGDPVAWQVGGQCAGLAEGLCLMQPGAVYRFTIPPSLGFGEEAHGRFPPNSVMLYEVELHKVL